MYLLSTYYILIIVLTLIMSYGMCITYMTTSMLSVVYHSLDNYSINTATFRFITYRIKDI